MSDLHGSSIRQTNQFPLIFQLVDIVKVSHYRVGRLEMSAIEPPCWLESWLGLQRRTALGHKSVDGCLGSICCRRRRGSLDLAQWDETGTARGDEDDLAGLGHAETDGCQECAEGKGEDVGEVR